AVEILYVIKENRENEEIKDEIELNFRNWSDYFITSTPSSVPTSPSPTSTFTQFSTPQQSPLSPTMMTFPLSQEKEEKEQKPKRKMREIPTKVARSLSKFQQRQQQQFTRKRIIEDVIKLFDDRRKINKNIREIETEYNKLLQDKSIDKEDSDSILSKLKEILKEIELLPKRKGDEGRDSLERDVKEAVNNITVIQQNNTVNNNVTNVVSPDHATNVQPVQSPEHPEHPEHQDIHYLFKIVKTIKKYIVGEEEK
ncbi:hypothetical protein C1645_819012, partial [Glomus cerebriforme]